MSKVSVIFHHVFSIYPYPYSDNGPLFPLSLTSMSPWDKALSESWPRLRSIISSVLTWTGNRVREVNSIILKERALSDFCCSIDITTIANSWINSLCSYDYLWNKYCFIDLLYFHVQLLTSIITCMLKSRIHSNPQGCNCWSLGIDKEFHPPN